MEKRAKKAMLKKKLGEVQARSSVEESTPNPKP